VPTREEDLNVANYLNDPEGFTLKYFGVENEPDVGKKENKI
jgi:hypothetical protein